MIYGLNFGGPVIPDTPRSAFRKFPKRVKVPCKDCHGRGFIEDPGLGHVSNSEVCRTCRRGESSRVGQGYLWYTLQGIAQTPEERDTMLIVADNGHRKLHVEERSTAGSIWFGIYCW